MTFIGKPEDAGLQWVIAACCLLISGFTPVIAEDFPDPTRPPASIFAPAPAAGNEAAETRLTGLRTIIISATRRAAIIDGQTVELGETHGDARLIEVNEGSVVLQRAQGNQMLTLFPGVKIVRSQTPDPKSVEPQSVEKQSVNSSLSKTGTQDNRPAGRVRSRKHKARPIAHEEKPLMKPLAIPLGSPTTATKRLDTSEHPKEEK